MGSCTSKHFYKLIAACSLVVLLDSCKSIHALFPKSKGSDVNHKLLFADPKANNAFENKSTLQDFANENKIRIISINKITNDTIIEWVDPIEITGGKKLVIPTKEKEANSLDTILTYVTKESEILKPHKAIIFQNTDGGKSFQTRNDTLFVCTSPQKMESLMFALLGKNVQSAPVDIANKKVDTDAESVGLGRQKINAKLKSTKEKAEKKKVNIKSKSVKVNAEEIIESNTEVLDNSETTPLPTTSLLVNSNTIVGDLNFDTDPNAIVVMDIDTIKNFIQSQIYPWHTFKCKAKVKLKSNEETKAFNTNFRMKKDEATWASINILGLGEFARAFATPDSIKVMDKWKDRYFHYTTADLQNILGLPIPYNSIQDYIIGNPPITEGTQMLCKKSEKGMAIKIIKPGMSCVLTYNADSTLMAIVIVGNANGKSYSIKNILGNYEANDHGRISTSRLVYFLENGKETTISLDLSKCEFEQELDFPFAIPEHFADGNKERLK
jgi:hypothetical protein